MEKQNETKFTLCMLCFVPCNENFEVVDDTKLKMLETMTLELDLSVNKELAVCMCCARNLKKSFDFKTKCLEIEQRLKLFSNDESNEKPYLAEIYLNKYGNQDRLDLPEDHTVCRLCIKLVNTDCSIPFCSDTKDAAFLSLYLPELVINVTADPVICFSCYTSLQEFLQFMKLCSSSVKNTYAGEVVDSNIKNKLDQNLILKNSIKCENDCKLEIVEKCHQNDLTREITSNSECVLGTEDEMFHIKSEPIDSESEQIGYDSIPPSQPTNYTQQSTNKTYGCKLCEFKTNCKHVIERHVVAHKEPSEVIYHVCNICFFKTNHKPSLKRHMEAHDGATKKDLPPFRCEICPFRTKHRSSFKRHKSIHSTASEPQKYCCNFCDYKSKYKHSLDSHLVSHQNPSDTTTRMYQCTDCEFKTKWKSSLNIHMSGAVHRKTLESRPYKCEVCGFKTKLKYRKHHMLVHQDIIGPPGDGRSDNV